MFRFILIAAFAASLILSACGGNAPAEPTALAPTQIVLAPTLAPTQPVAPTNTTAPTQTLEPTKPPATATLAPTTTPEPTSAPSATIVASDENCVACHTSQSQLEELAVNTTVKSEETSGEG